jgi:serine/threonine protein kinase
MTLVTGQKLGPYEILATIGAGGMGEVYRARDTRLGREVAIKVSQERFNERFDREAHVISSLNHPNICALYDIGPDYLVMEYVEGDSPRGPMPVDDALAIAMQIADALQEAHERGIVHRDLKPANIRITPSGKVKVLDFGLAKIGGTATVPSDNSPTISMAGTQAGVILGTAAYMAPEQARGKPVDARADIWAFGVVLFELITGDRLFKGDDLTETLASVVKEQPDLSAVPQRARRLLDACLQRDPRKRLQSIGDVARGVFSVAPQRQHDDDCRAGDGRQRRHGNGRGVGVCAPARDAAGGARAASVRAAARWQVARFSGTLSRWHAARDGGAYRRSSPSVVCPIARVGRLEAARRDERCAPAVLVT